MTRHHLHKLTAFRDVKGALVGVSVSLNRIVVAR
jgi:hypothetical protein